MATDGPPPIPRVVPRPTQTVVIDAGHGGVDPGAVGISGTYEKTLTLAMARQLRDLLRKTGRYRVVLTRDDDVFVPLRERIHLAREAGGSLFISLHADAQARETTHGASVYTLSETASDSEAALLASKENKSDIIAGTDLRNHDAMVTSILIDLAQRDTNNKSIEFADILSAELAGVTPLLRRHRRFAGFAVLKSPDMPSALVELGYISNAGDEKNLADVAYRAKLAAAVLRAVDRYFADIKS
jgi:N-acetylmuramoyl-L-alanine amidase